MPLTPEQFIKRLSALTDPSYLCEVLNITSEDIIERFEDLVEEKSEILRETFDIDLNLNEEEYE